LKGHLVPLPAWITSRLSNADIWNGSPLPQRNPVHQDTHYRIYDRRNGQLLSFGTTNVLDVVATDILRTSKEHPNAAVHVVQVDGPAYR
jgi:hypothetical protein